MQIVGSPDDFMAALRQRFGPISLDLAANKHNTVARRFYGRGSMNPDAFAVKRWPTLRASWAYCNPPFGDITRWVARIMRESARGCRTLLLVPAAVGADWFNTFIRPYAYVLELTPRLKFKGHTHGFPKDLVLCVFTPERLTGRQMWRWKKSTRVISGHGVSQLGAPARGEVGAPRRAKAAA